MICVFPSGTDLDLPEVKVSDYPIDASIVTACDEICDGSESVPKNEWQSQSGPEGADPVRSEIWERFNYFSE